MPAKEQFDYSVQIPDIDLPGRFEASRVEGRQNLFAGDGSYYIRLERLAALASMGAARELLEASGLHLNSKTSSDDPRRHTITLTTDTLANISDKTHRLAEPGVVTAGPRMRLGLYTQASLFSMRTLVDTINKRTTLISCVPPSSDPEVRRANNVKKVHDLLDHAAAALLQSDEVVQLEVKETGKRLDGLVPGENSHDVHEYASVYDNTADVSKVLRLLSGERTHYDNWQYLLGVGEATMDGIVERWQEQLNNLVVPKV